MRVPPQLHKRLSDMAKSQKLSLNQVCLYLINNGFNLPEKNALLKKLQTATKKINTHFGNNLLGIVLFGSKARGDSSDSSDIDLLLILDKNIPITRSLYSWWDSSNLWQEDEQLSPHFVSLPEDLDKVSGLWLEVAVEGKILYQKNNIVDKLFLKLKELINNGSIRRYISNGHPYWVRRNNEK